MGTPVLGPCRGTQQRAASAQSGQAFPAPTGWPSEPTSFASTPPPTTLCPADPSTPAQVHHGRFVVHTSPSSHPTAPCLAWARGGPSWLSRLSICPDVHHLALPSRGSTHEPLPSTPSYGDLFLMRGTCHFPPPGPSESHCGSLSPQQAPIGRQTDLGSSPEPAF